LVNWWSATVCAEECWDSRWDSQTWSIVLLTGASDKQFDKQLSGTPAARIRYSSLSMNARRYNWWKTVVQRPRPPFIPLMYSGICFSCENRSSLECNHGRSERAEDGGSWGQWISSLCCTPQYMVTYSDCFCDRPCLWQVSQTSSTLYLVSCLLLLAYPRPWYHFYLPIMCSTVRQMEELVASRPGTAAEMWTRSISRLSTIVHILRMIRFCGWTVFYSMCTNSIYIFDRKLCQCFIWPHGLHHANEW
jgi:hypothetical protein